MDIQIPCNQQLYKMIIDLNSKYETLQNDYNNIKKSIKNYEKNIDIIEFLNFKYNNNIYDLYDFETFLRNIDINIENIDNVFKYDYIEGLSKIFDSFISSYDLSSLPFKAFNNYKNILFIYTSHKSDNYRWIQFDNMFNDYFFGIINTKLLNALKNWQLFNQDKINEDIFTKIYFTNMKKVMGTNFKNDVKITFKNKLYNLYKKDFVY